MKIKLHRSFLFSEFNSIEFKRYALPFKVISQALVARTTPPFSNFLFTNLFSRKFLYFFIISSLFPYFNLFVSIFIQSYVNIKLHVSTLLDTNITQGMQLGRFKNRTPVSFEYIYCTLFNTTKSRDSE